MLRGEGHDVRTASTGEEGLQALGAAPLPDVVVLDVDMPILGGPGMAHRMLLHDAGEQLKIPILLMSARDDLPQIAARIGTPYYLHKACDIDGFLRLLDRALRERIAPLWPDELPIPNYAAPLLTSRVATRAPVGK